MNINEVSRFGKAIWRKLMNILGVRDDVEAIIYDLLDSGAVRFDIQHDTNGTVVWGPDGCKWLRLTSTRELLTDEIRDKILRNWREALGILSDSLWDKLDLSDLTGLCIWQSDYGFDPHKLEFRDNHNMEGHYRYEGCGL